MHPSQNWMLVPGLARPDISRYKAVVPGIAEVAGDWMIPDMWDNAAMNALALKSDAERYLGVLLTASRSGRRSTWASVRGARPMSRARGSLRAPRCLYRS
jgi:hypothetical protein